MSHTLFGESKLNRKIIGIRIYNDGDNFWCGYIEDFNDVIFQMRHFDKYGREDGILVGPIDQIETIEWDQDYHQVFNYLTSQEQNRSNILKTVDLKNDENWIRAYLQEFHGEEGVVSFETNTGDDYYGIIDEVSDSGLIIRPVDNHGQCAGKTFFKLDDIKIVRWGDIQSKFRWSLYQWRRSLE